MIRLIKTGIALSIALMCLFYGIQILMNLQSAHSFVALMASTSDHAAYPNHFGPPIASAALVWVMHFIIIGAELLAGALAASGAPSMWTARRGDAGSFNATKSHAGMF